MKFSDEELMVMYSSGVEEAFDMLYERYRHRIYRFALSCTFNPADSEDIVQDVFIRVTRSVSTYRPSGRFRSWLFQIAANRIRTHHSTRARQRNGAERFRRELACSEDRGSEPGLTAGDSLCKALSAIPTRQRLALVLKEVEGMSCVEIAHGMNITHEHVRVLLHRARKNVISFLHQDQGDTES